MKPLEIISTIEKIAPLAFAAAWDISGVQVASRLEQITTVAVMLDPVLPALQKAADDGANFILTHHPLSMKPRFPNAVDDYTDILALLFRKGAWLYSAHTSLDANPAGPVRWLAKELGLVQVRLLEPVAEAPSPGRPCTDNCYQEDAPLSGHGFGFIGDLPEALTYDAFCSKLREYLHLPHWSACGSTPKTVRRVACCPGSGSDLVPLARHAGADVLLTGDVRYHAALDASGLLPRILDVGHFSLEEEMMRRFAAQLGKELSVPVTFYPAQDPLEKE